MDPTGQSCLKRKRLDNEGDHGLENSWHYRTSTVMACINLAMLKSAQL